ncbi:xylulokinase [Providencia rettgeri]|uniref:xylulokinase n=1 Tax=Providencia sp. PROV021 TaxID=2949756 RepID=UPI00234BDD70|nr:xylulokinase [Providencia sp. PROV021]
MYLGIDLGTSELKAVLINAQGEIVASSHMALTVQRPHSQWAEQSPDSWWEATNAVAATLRQKAPEAWAAVKAIGLSGQMHGAVLLNSEHQVLRDCILWNDTRSAKECEWLMANHPEFLTIGANLVMPGFTAPKLLWVARYEPEIFKKVAKVLLPKDYLRWKMTGQFTSDMSDASGTLWLDVAKRDWSDELLAATNLTREQMPSLVEGAEKSGVLRADLASQWGLSADVIIAGGGGDNAASAVGVGAVNDGDALISLGTSGVIFVVNNQLQAAPHQGVHAFAHALPNRWHQMSVMLSAANCLRWLCQLLSTTENQLMDEVGLLTDDEKKQAPVFLPYLSGERTPHNDPYAMGSFFALKNETTRAQLGYAVIEGVTFALADGMQVLTQTGTQISRCSLTGGGARSPVWAQLIADVIDIPIVTHPASSSGALGAARLAWLADGGNTETVCQKPEVLSTYLPQKQCQTWLNQRLDVFRLLYQQQKQARELLPQ